MNRQFMGPLRASNTPTDMNRLSTTLLALAGTILAFEGQAAEAPVTLRVKPLLCITDERNPDCDLLFEVEWKSGQPGNFCLGDDGSPSPLDCWEDADSGDFVEQRVVDQSFRYLLLRPGQLAPVAEARVELMTIDNSDRRRNRRSRHAWSIL